jgi:O-methyltransferase involved in polyketide biosynthesis
MKKLNTEELLKKVQERVSKEELEQGWKLEVLDRMVPELRNGSLDLYQAWVQPLLDAGLSREAALALIAEHHYRPN